MARETRWRSKRKGLRVGPSFGFVWAMAGATDAPATGAASVRNYVTVTGAYWVFTLTDGALRMLVLLFLHEQGYSPLQIASLFLFYEFFGVVTNLVGGYLGARFGLRATLFIGLAMQVVACGLLGAQAAALSMPVAMLAQAISGVAKDLTKMSAKSYVKFVVPAGQGSGLLKWVALLTGSKNTLKGVGFFLGGLLLQLAGFAGACWGMAAALAVALFTSVLLLPRAAGGARGGVSWRSMLAHDRRVNWLSAARFFLFGARDIWFVLAVPLFLTESCGWEHAEVGSFLALWVIGYGVVQAVSPALLGRGTPADAGEDLDQRPPAATLAVWALALLLPLAAIVAAFEWSGAPQSWLVVGLVMFGVVFAINSALHSYLILVFADGTKVATKVGFYYMANAAGRLVGTVLSGALYQVGGGGTEGVQVCVLGSMTFVVLSVLCARKLRHP